ncbi:hypothetical protein [Paenibacillus kyungheensis]
MYKKIVPVILLSVALTACGSANKEATPATESNTVATNESATTAQATTTEFKTYDADLFSIDYPASWKEYDTSNLNQPSVQIAFVDPAPKAKFADNLNVTMEASSSNTTAKANSEQLIKFYETSATYMENFKLIEYKDNDNNSGVLVGEYTQPETKENVVLTQYLVPSNGNFYAISLSLGKASYDNGGKAMVDQMIESFTLNDETNTNNEVTAEQATSSAQTVTADMMTEVVPNVVEDGALDDSTYNYIVDNSNLFPATTAADKKLAKAEVDSTITSKHLFKNINPYLDTMVSLTGDIIQVQEQETAYGTVATIHISDENDNSIVGIYKGSTGDILDGDNVTMRGVPTASYSFENVGGGTTNAVLLTVSTIQKN